MQTYIASMVMTFAGGFTLMAYKSYADSTGWPKQSWLHNDWVAILGGLSWIGVVFAAIGAVGFWSVAVIVGGLVGSFIMLTFVKTWSGPLSVVLIVAGYLFLYFVH